jgi:hypothetical protein
MSGQDSEAGLVGDGVLSLSPRQLPLPDGVEDQTALSQP